ncbi:hypothetical protein L484_012363 [Morus notabilis]|uniref:Uncharacterized protein n=1 Tax=Morus notabilis TaxID=981085 RepID=W9S921_9ROSA|nr:hypothetical protein L484_012363 [Morus notabilis]
MSYTWQALGVVVSRQFHPTKRQKVEERIHFGGSTVLSGTQSDVSTLVSLKNSSLMRRDDPFTCP